MSWIKLHRQLLDSEVFASEKALKIWIWLLLKARFSKGFVSIKIGTGQHGVEIKRGQLLFGRFSAEEELSINGSTIYKWIQKFEALGMININSNNHYTLITIDKFNEYNDIGNSHVTANEQPSNSHVTQYKNVQEGRECSYVEQNILDLRTNQPKQESVCRATGLTLITIKPFIEEFIKITEPGNELDKLPQQVWGHFTRWVKIEVKKNKTDNDYPQQDWTSANY